MTAYPRGVLGVYLLGLAACLATAAPPAPPASAPAPPASVVVPAEVLADLGRAIDAFLNGQYDASEERFKALLADPAAADYRVAFRYYLGLIDLDRGLARSKEASDARGAGNAQAYAAKAGEARAYFEQALAQFEALTIEDPQGKVVSAALLLGIAQLARADPEVKQTALRLALHAEDTLNQYVQSAEGANDRYGYFYLAAARYRLADEYSVPPNRDRARFTDAVRRARESLTKARQLADADFERGTLDENGRGYFQTVLTYYDGLLDTLVPDYAAARERFSQVRTSQFVQEKSDLQKNADDILRKLETARFAPAAAQPVAVPGLGPLLFEGHVRMGQAFDSNVILLGKETILPRGFTRKDDYQFGLMAEFNLRRVFQKEELRFGESLEFGFGAATENLWQPNIPQFDINRYPGRAWVNFQLVPDLYLGVQYEYAYTQLGHRAFISSQRVTPVVSKVWRRAADQPAWGQTDLYFSTEDRDYFDRLADFRLNRDGTYQATGVRQTLNLWQARDLPWMQHDLQRASPLTQELFGNRWLNFYAGYEYRSERTVGTEFDNVAHSVLWGFDVPLPHRFGLEVGGEFAWADYLNPSLFDFGRRDRADFAQRYGCALVYTLVARGEQKDWRTLDIKLRGGVDLTFQNSNVTDRLGEHIYEYDRALYGIVLDVSF